MDIVASAITDFWQLLHMLLFKMNKNNKLYQALLKDPKVSYYTLYINKNSLNFDKCYNFNWSYISRLKSEKQCFVQPNVRFSGEEKEVNPFMRVSQDTVRRFAGNLDNDIDTMAAVSAAKDKFRMP